MNSSVVLVLLAIINLIFGFILIAVFHNNVGFVSLLLSSICMGIVFINDVVKN